jgi:hypothetical protein
MGPRDKKYQWFFADGNPEDETQDGNFGTFIRS